MCEYVEQEYTSSMKMSLLVVQPFRDGKSLS